MKVYKYLSLTKNDIPADTLALLLDSNADYVPAGADSGLFFFLPILLQITDEDYYDEDTISAGVEELRKIIISMQKENITLLFIN